LNLKTKAIHMFRTFKFASCMLILQHNEDTNAHSVMVRERDGALWEAVRTHEEKQMRLDDMDQLTETELSDAMRAHSWCTDLCAFRATHHPSRACAFELKFADREGSAITGSSILAKKRPLTRIECIGLRKEQGRLKADFFVEYKQVDHDLELHLTFYSSIRLTLCRVPEFDEEDTSLDEQQNHVRSDDPGGGAPHARSVGVRSLGGEDAR